MATHSSILAWRIPTDRGAWRATAMGSQRKEQDDKPWMETYVKDVKMFLFLKDLS